MPRKRTKYRGFPEHLMVRELKTKTLYYYAIHGMPRKPLGEDLGDAIAECKALNEGSHKVVPQKIAQALERFRTEYLPTLAAKTAYEYGRAILRLTEVYGGGTFAQVEPHHLMKHYKNSTSKARARNDIACFSSFWTWARGEGLHKLPNPREGLLFQPKKNADGSRKEKRYVTDAEKQAVWDAGDTVVQDALDLLYLTGADVNVMLRWKRTDIDEDNCLPTKRTKTGKGNRKELFQTNDDGHYILDSQGNPIPTELKRVIDRCLTRPRTATGLYIVQTDAGQRVTDNMLRKRFTLARRAAGVWFELRQIRAKTATDTTSDERAAELLNNDPRTARAIYRRGPKVRPLR